MQRDNAREALELLTRQIRQAGILLSFCRPDSKLLRFQGRQVYGLAKVTHKRTGHIYIDRSLSSANQLAFLGHELGHFMTDFRGEDEAWRWAFAYLTRLNCDLPEWFKTDAALAKSRYGSEYGAEEGEAMAPLLPWFSLKAGGKAG